MNRYLVVFLLFLSQLNFVNAQCGDLQNCRWTTLDTKGEVVARHENAFVEYKGEFYLIGGRGNNPVNVFNPRENSWKTNQKPPLEIHHFQAVVYNNAIYIMGAMTGPYPDEKPIENILIYYPEEDRWEFGPEIPEDRRRGGAGVVLYQDKLYMVAGIENGHLSGTNNYFDSYDLKTGEWEVLTKAPHVRDHFSAILVRDKLYCVGGRNTSVHYPDNFYAFFESNVGPVDVYDFNNQKWETLENPIPYPTAAGAVAYFENRILYMGGEATQKQAYNHTQCLDIETGTWCQLSPLNIGRHGSHAIVYENKIYFAAGSENQGGGNLNSIEVFSLQHNWISLFNGKNLEGWQIKCTEKDKDKDFWYVKDGNIVCNSLESSDHHYVWLQTTEEYSDFELRLKFQVSGLNKGNSGVQFRSRYDENAKVEDGFTGWLDGPQVDINPAGAWRTGYIYDETRNTKRWIYPGLPDWRMSEEDYSPDRVIFYHEDEETGWNDMTIICKGMHIQTIVNNLLVSDFDATGVLDDETHLKYNVSQKGHIALQLHKGDQNLIMFKDIMIRDLSF